MSDRSLQIFLETLRSEIRSEHPDLTLRQLAVMLVVYGTHEPQTVRGLAAYLNLRKPTVVRCLDRLRDFHLARRIVDRQDRRSVNVVWTEEGATMMRRLGRAMATAATAL